MDPRNRADGGGRLAFGVGGALVAGAVALALAWQHNDRSPGPAVSAATDEPRSALISAGTTHTCAVTRKGGVRCWGANADWQLGNGIRTWSRVPVDALGLQAGVRSVAAGGAHSCALTDAGAVRCWSQETAALSFPAAPNGSARPVPVEGLGARVVAIDAGNGHTCALTDAGVVSCWGVFTRSDASTATLRVPTAVPGLGPGVKAIGVGYDNQCALTAAGAVRCWGQDYEATPEAAVLASAEVLPDGTDAVALDVGGRSACLLTATGAVRCWEHPRPGAAKLGEPAVLTDIRGAGEDVRAVTVGYAHACARTRRGGVLCWGANSHGELGDGTATGSDGAVEVAGLRSGTAAVSAGFQHSCAVLRDGQALCWGYNFEGQLGNGASTISFSTVPLRVAS